MTSIFDLFEEKVEETPQSIEPEKAKETSVFDVVQEAQETEQQQPWWKSVPGDMLKGLLVGTEKLGRTFGPLEDPRSESQIQEQFSEKLEEVIPTDETFVGSAARRGLEIAPSAIAQPYGGAVKSILQSGASGLAGQTAEELGAPGWVQSIAEIAPFLTPSLVKGLSTKKTTEEAVDFMRKQGMTDKQITPLLQGERTKIFGKQLPTRAEVLSKVSEKGRGVQEKLKATKKGLGEIYGNLKNDPKALTVLTDSEATSTMNKLQDVLFDMPAKVRNVVMEDFNQLSNSPKDGKSFIKFFQDVNANMSDKTKQLSALKGPIKDALAKISPKLSKDFNMTNNLYQKYFDISKKLKPSLASQLIDATVPLRIMYGIGTGGYSFIAEAVGEKAARKLSAEMLTNPKFQNLSKQFVQAMNQGKVKVANAIRDQYVRLMKDDHPEAALEIQKANFDDLE